MLLKIVGITVASIFVLERCCQPWLRRRLTRLVQRWVDDQTADPDGSFFVNDKLRGRFQCTIDQGDWWHRPFGRIYLELTPIDPQAEFAFQVATQKRANVRFKFLEEKDGLKRLKRRYSPNEGAHAFWALMDKETRTFFIANHLEVKRNTASVQIVRSGLAWPFMTALLNRRRIRLQKHWASIATRALTPSSLTTLAELLLYGEDKHLCRTALLHWMIQNPYDPETYRELPSPDQTHFPEYWWLWLYCGGPVDAAKRRQLLADQNHDSVAFLTTLLTHLPELIRLDLCLTAATFPHLAETACRLMRESQNPLVVPHLIALHAEVTHRDAIGRGLLIENDSRALAFFRILIQTRNLPTRIRGAYGLAAVGDRNDLETLGDIKRGSDYRFSSALEQPILRLRNRLGLNNETAGMLETAHPPEESGALSHAEIHDLTPVTADADARAQQHAANPDKN